MTVTFVGRGSYDIGQNGVGSAPFHRTVPAPGGINSARDLGVVSMYFIDETVEAVISNLSSGWFVWDDTDADVDVGPRMRHVVLFNYGVSGNCTFDLSLDSYYFANMSVFRGPSGNAWQGTSFGSWVNGFDTNPGANNPVLDLGANADFTGNDYDGVVGALCSGYEKPGTGTDQNPTGTTCSTLSGAAFNFASVLSTNWRRPVYDNPYHIRAQGDALSYDTGNWAITYQALQSMDEYYAATVWAAVSIPQLPVAALNVTPANGLEPLFVSADASGSTG